MLKKPQSLILFLIVLSQFLCSSLWFAGNSIVYDLALAFDFSENNVSSISSFLQFGFIVGTIIYALLAIADRFSPSKVFFASAILGAFANAAILFEFNSLPSILFFRLLTGFFLAGIYPVGMKIAADHFDKGLGKSLGYLVGALVLGTAFPHFLTTMSFIPSWEIVIVCTSALALLGGLFIFFFVPDGPYRKKGTALNFSSIATIFKHKEFKSASFGYFGHMWELYAFWVFVPVILNQFSTMHSAEMNVSLWSFIIIGIGSLASVFSGLLAPLKGAKNIARFALNVSLICCVISPVFFFIGSLPLFLFFLIIWGLSVIADSPMLSTLVAQSAPPENKGSALTIVNCIGFSMTIISIQLLTYLQPKMPTEYLFVVLAIGPLLGLLSLRRSK